MSESFDRTNTNYTEHIYQLDAKHHHIVCYNYSTSLVGGGDHWHVYELDQMPLPTNSKLSIIDFDAYCNDVNVTNVILAIYNGFQYFNYTPGLFPVCTGFPTVLGAGNNNPITQDSKIKRPIHLGRLILDQEPYIKIAWDTNTLATSFSSRLLLLSTML